MDALKVINDQDDFTSPLISEERVVSNILLHSRRKYFKLKGLAREMLAEFFGTMIMLMFVIGASCQVKLSSNSEGISNSGSFLTSAISSGVGLMFGVYTSLSISGAHLNPALSVALAFHHRFPWRKVPGYMAAQVLGAFTAAAIIYGLYYDAIDFYDKGTRTVVGSLETASVFCSYPLPYLTHWTGIFDQIIGTGILVCGISALMDQRNNAPAPSLQPIMLTLLIIGIGCSFGLNSGYALNPARDIGPRIFTAFVYGSEVFTAYNYWFYIPFLVPFVGALLGSVSYVIFVELQHE